MINHKHKFLFIHIPRTGGSSIESQFNYKENKEKNKHWTLNDWKNILSSDIFEDYFKFTFIRNPWDIMISNYFDKGWYSSPIKGRGGEIGYYSGKTLKYFLNNYQPAKHEHGDSLLDYINPKQMDYIGRFENRSQDLKYISNKIGININSNIKSRVKKDKKHYTEYYDDETREIVAEKYARDIEYFGYKFGE
jgi:hypothetical protein